MLLLFSFLAKLARAVVAFAAATATSGPTRRMIDDLVCGFSWVRVVVTAAAACDSRCEPTAKKPRLCVTPKNRGHVLVRLLSLAVSLRRRVWNARLNLGYFQKRFKVSTKLQALEPKEGKVPNNNNERIEALI